MRLQSSEAHRMRHSAPHPRSTPKNRRPSGHKRCCERDGSRSSRTYKRPSTGTAIMRSVQRKPHRAQDCRVLPPEERPSGAAAMFSGAYHAAKHGDLKFHFPAERRESLQAALQLTPRRQHTTHETVAHQAISQSTRGSKFPHQIGENCATSSSESGSRQDGSEAGDTARRIQQRRHPGSTRVFGNRAMQVRLSREGRLLLRRVSRSSWP